MTERKMATIRRIDAIDPIEGADAIDVATVGGWKVVVKKGAFQPGDLAVYCEVDSFIPTALAPFLTKPGHVPKVYEGVEGERLRTVRLRKQLSQGLLLPILYDEVGSYMMVMDAETGEYSSPVSEGEDVSAELGILKYEPPIPACLSGISRGSFPSAIPKSDQERIQNLSKELPVLQENIYEVTEKLEGSSMTVYLIDGEFGVCSRNLNLLEVVGNTFWDVARKLDLETKMRGCGKANLAIQGELVGEGVQGNIYGLKGHHFFVYDMYFPDLRAYFTPLNRLMLCDTLGIEHVPVLDGSGSIAGMTMGDIIAYADGQSALSKTAREGVVFKSRDGTVSFKAVSNKYLTNQKE